MAPDPDITALLQAHESGDTSALDQLLPIVYEQLRVQAQQVFGRQRGDHTLQPTALAHEAWLKLNGGMHGVTSRHHFFAVAARAMRQVLTDHARAARTGKREHGREVFALDGFPGASGRELDLLVVHDLLERLARLHERHARVVELRVYGGLTIAETADVLGVAPTTVGKDWAAARAWLALELKKS